MQLITNWKFLIIYGLNQLGSLVFQLFIGFVDLGIGSLVANGVSLVINYAVECLLGLKKASKCKKNIFYSRWNFRTDLYHNWTRSLVYWK